jgi:hypothetical protein
MQAGGGEAGGDRDEGTHVLVRRRRVHHDQRRSARGEPEVAAKARIARRRRERRRIEPVRGDERSEPALECGAAAGVGPLDRRRGGKGRHG